MGWKENLSEFVKDTPYLPRKSSFKAELGKIHEKLKEVN